MHQQFAPHLPDELVGMLNHLPLAACNGIRNYMFEKCIFSGRCTGGQFFGCVQFGSSSRLSLVGDVFTCSQFSLLFACTDLDVYHLDGGMSRIACFRFLVGYLRASYLSRDYNVHHALSWAAFQAL